METIFICTHAQNDVIFIRFKSVTFMHTMEPHHILKVKNAEAKSGYYFTEYTTCKLFVRREEFTST